ncbi:hypothetical protein [Nannocystis punicea]|uniref:Lipoprotein n=1 Tax=Nannocystis punicea TaxID=2995304 RepID=A0ABY7GTL4_9BACT|nr:hypothetical protein [Nannocystis poenicansa]WAS90271.1 hypothetical protein O0S08_29105 [Nannocystis poenicansa]
MRARPAPGLGLVLAPLIPLLLAPAGCASSVCSKVQADRAAFTRRAATPGPHLALAVPYATLSQSVQRSLAGMPQVRLPLPDLGPVDLGSLAVAIRSVAFRPAPAGSVGARVTVALTSQGKPVTALELDAVIAPRLDPREGSVRLRLGAADLREVRPSLPPAERKRFAEFLLSIVPGAARALVGREQVEALAETFLRELVGGRWPQIRDNLLQGTDDLVDVEIDLGDVPLTKIELKSGAADLELWAHAALPAAALSSGTARPAGSDARLVGLRMSGGVAAALANRAIASGQIPERYNRDGAPDPRGELVAGVDWRAGERPLKVHAWSTEGTCARLTFGGTPKVGARGGELAVDVADGTLEEVTGALRVRAAVWFSGLGRQTFTISESVADAIEFEILGVDYRARVVAAAVSPAELEFSLALAEAPQPATPRR